MVDEKTGYINLMRFSATTGQEFKDSLVKLQARGMENLILDLQNNGGGYLGASIELSNEFLKQGSLIVYTEGVNQKREEARSNSSGSFRNGRLVIIVDETSASASEIVSGAVQDWDRGVIVGRRTFGKGLVQRPIPLPDGSMIRLTSARYYTPTGRSIQKPYIKGDKGSYNKELIDRYNRGEMISADSIHFPDSLRYNTLTKNRTVYGGGGIMPDYFVPVDTANAIFTDISTSLYKEIYNKSILYKYVRGVIEANRKKYQEQYPAFDSFKKNFTVSNNMLNDMLDIYIKEKAEELKEKTYQLTEEQQKDLEKSKSRILQDIKMLIVREVYGDNEFYQLWIPANPFLMDTYNKAIEIINDEEEYNKLLNQDRG
jgi:carboxyl-terminal processing protease